MHPGPRGAPENVGTTLSAVHPVIRTNPVTGWKSVFAVGHHVQQINGLTKEESDEVLSWFVRLITENHDLQVRHRWVNENDLGTFSSHNFLCSSPDLRRQDRMLTFCYVAIWDNRSVYHAATPDYTGPRLGQRAVSVGERPYLDPASKSRQEDLASQKGSN